MHKQRMALTIVLSRQRTHARQITIASLMMNYSRRPEDVSKFLYTVKDGRCTHIEPEADLGSEV